MASYHSHSAAAAFPGSESRPEPEAKSCTFSVFMLALVSFVQLTDGVKTPQTHTEQSLDAPFCFYVRTAKEKQNAQTHTKVSGAVTGCGSQSSL